MPVSDSTLLHGFKMLVIVIKFHEYSANKVTFIHSCHRCLSIMVIQINKTTILGWQMVMQVKSTYNSLNIRQHTDKFNFWQMSHSHKFFPPHQNFCFQYFVWNRLFERQLLSGCSNTADIVCMPLFSRQRGEIPECESLPDLYLCCLCKPSLIKWFSK